MARTFFVLGSLLGGLGVAAGAFGAHALRGRIAPDELAIYETAVRYQLLHALALLAVAWAVTRWEHPAVAAAGWLFAAGVVVFSGSLYLLVASGVRWLGAVTPLGGLSLIVGWFALAWGVLRS